MKRAIADSDEVGWMGERIVTLADRENAAVYEMLGFIREFDVCRGWARDGVASCSEWLQRFAGLADGKARERVRVAHALGTFGAIDAALHDGTLSYSKVRAIVRVATADNEAALIEESRTRTAAELEKMASRIRREQAAESGNPTPDRESRWVRRSEMDDGTVRIVAQLPADEAEMVMTAVDAMAVRLGNTGDAEPFDRADGLVALAQAAIAGDGSHRPIDMTIHVDAGTLLGRSDRPAVMGRTFVSAESARRILCDCRVTPWRSDEHGNAIDIGRTSRTIPAGMRRVMLARDNNQCRFPGCTHHMFLEGHHVHEWENGGPTALHNLITMCNLHHGFVHEGGASIERYDGDFVFFDPNGDVIESASRRHRDEYPRRHRDEYPRRP